MPEQTNAERTVNCPIEGCTAEKLARGIHLHVRQSSGRGHGRQGEIPDGVSFDNLETTGSQEVSMDYPDTRETEEVGRLCPYCDSVFRGKQGVMIHLGRMAGKEPHPENPKEKVDSENLAIVHVDEDGDIVEVVKQATVMPSTRQRREHERTTSLEERVRDVIKEFRYEGKEEAAERLEDVLRDA